MSHVVWYGGQRGVWSQTIVEWLVNGYHHHTRVDTVPATMGAVVVIKADAYLKDRALMNCVLHEVKKLRWAVVIVVSNEEGQFPTTLFLESCPNIKIWLQSRAPFQFAHEFLPWGWTHAQPNFGVGKKLDWCFLGQVTHERRRQCVEAFLPLKERGFLLETQGFSQGLPHDLYHRTLAAARFVPCPSGPITVDSFRVCEALQMDAIPLLDTRSPAGPDPNYWTEVFDQHPLPLVDDWSEAPRIMEDWLIGYKVKSQMVRDWWRWQKIVWQRTFDLHQRQLDNG